ncbi:MAG TPA: glutamate synthase subunit beta [Baekduia sp.]|nr:glutamate synthase subunit beta [Baekduia sp.]
MGELGGFLKIERHGIPYRDATERIGDFREFVVPRPDEELAAQGARCMECGVPFCHNGCPLGNLIPDWNDLVFRGRWQDAIKQLHATNNFPEFTGRLCPAPCEAACVLEIREGDSVTIKQIEQSIIDHAWASDWVAPQPPRTETGRTVAVVGAGPAGMAAAQQLRRAGHAVTLFERDEAAGGLIRFGVPDFKIEKWIVERRVQQLVDEGVELRLNTEATPAELDGFDAVVLATGSRVPRDLPVEGRELAGIHPAMDYLYVRNRQVAAADGAPGAITAQGKHVVVIGGGDTGADCVANSIREGAIEVVQLEVLPQPPQRRPDDKTPWPLWPMKYRKSYAMEEVEATGKGEQDYAVSTQRFVGTDGQVGALVVADSDPANPFGPPLAGTDREIKADLVLLAMGFLHPEQELVDGLGLDKDQRNNIKAPTYETSRPGVFAAGDCRRGQSLIVWAINEGRQAARMADRYLEGLAEALHTGNVEPADEDGPAAAPPGHAQGAVVVPQKV